MPSDSELLAELTRGVDSVQARIPTVRDHTRGVVPSWCEVTLDIDVTDGASIGFRLTRHDSELIIECLNEVLHPNRVLSLQTLWSDMDAAMLVLMSRDTKKKTRRVMEGYARGLAHAIAVVMNPYAPDTANVRDEAMERYGNRARSAV
jgi:hypothetical protein